jgi:hypothetical protein
MLVTGLSEEIDEVVGVKSIVLADVWLTATPGELRSLAEFLLASASKLELPDFETQSQEFPNSGPAPLTGITFMVMPSRSGAL